MVSSIAQTLARGETWKRSSKGVVDLLVDWCHAVKLFHSKNIGFGTIFLHYHNFLIAYKNHDSKIFNILGIQHKNQMRGQEAA